MLASRPRRRRPAALLRAGGDARRSAVGAAAGRARRSVLHEHRRGGGRLGDEVRARRDGAAAAAVMRLGLSRRDARTALAGRRRLLQGWLRPAAAGMRSGSRSATSATGGTSCGPEDVAAFIVEPIQGRMVTLPPPELPAGGAGAVPPVRHAVRRSTRSRRGSGARARGSRSSSWGSNRTSCSSARRSAAATCRSPRWSRAETIYRARGRDARALLRASVDVRTQSPVDGGRSGDAAGDRARRPGRSRRADRRAAARRPRRAPRAPRADQGGPRRGLMIGIELGAPKSRLARVNWRLIHMASEGLFPQLVVIPLHRDHGVITMAAGKNDVIKLLPPLTLSEAEARALPRCARRGARRVRCAAPARTGPWCATSPRRRCAAARATVPGPRPAARVRSRRRSGARPPTPLRGDVCLVTGATRIHRRSSGAASGRGGEAGALPREGEQRHVAARGARCGVRCRRSGERAVARARDERLPVRVPLRRAGVRLGDDRGDRAHQRGRHAQPAAGVSRRIRAPLHPLQHHRRVRLSGGRRGRRDVQREPVSQLVRGDEAPGGGRGATRGPCARVADGDAASVDGLRSSLDRGRRRDRARDSPAATCCWWTGGRAVAGLAYVENVVDAALLASTTTTRRGRRST